MIQTLTFKVPKHHWEEFCVLCEENSIKILSSYPKEDLFGDIHLIALLKIDNSGEIKSEDKEKTLNDKYGKYNLKK